jgi:3-hydroxybenzoate 6-monooxygenase
MFAAVKLAAPLLAGNCAILEPSELTSLSALAMGEDLRRPFSEGLASYAALRAPRAMRVQRTARTWGEIWHVDGVAKLIRDELLLDRDPTDHKHVAWLYQDAMTGT